MIIKGFICNFCSSAEQVKQISLASCARVNLFTAILLFIMICCFFFSISNTVPELLYLLICFLVNEPTLPMFGHQGSTVVVCSGLCQVCFCCRKTCCGAPHKRYIYTATCVEFLFSVN